MRVSAIIPVYNGDRFIAQAVRSIRRQNYSSLEIIVVDDGSTDRTAEIVKGLSGVRYEYQENQGPGAARNRGLSLATGEAIAFCDADDQWSDDKLAIQVPLLEGSSRQGSREPGMVIGYSQRAIIRSEGNGSAVYEDVGAPVFYLHVGCALIQREVFEEIGVFAERLPAGEDQLTGQYGEDLDWFLRAKEADISIRFHKEVMQRYFRHDQNLTLDRGSVELSFVLAMKRSLDRRRASTRAPMLDWSRETSFE